MAFEYFTSATAAVADGVFIAVADLPGVTSAELGSGVAAKLKEDRSIFAICKKLFSTLSPTNFPKLGFDITNSEAKPASLLTNRSYNYLATYLSNIETGEVAQIPVPSTGTSSGVGKFALTDVFASAAKVDAGDNVPGAGILIVNADLEDYGVPAYSSLNIASGQDNRAYVAGFFNYLTDGGTAVRVTGTASAIILASRATPATFTLPALALDATNPTTGIVAADINKLIANQILYSVTIQTVDNLSTETFDVNVV